MIRFSPTLAAAVAALALSGCASIQSGTTQQVKVSSNPAGATVYIALKKDGVVTNKTAVGTSPLTVTLSRKHGALFVEKEGYVPAEVPLTTRTNPWMWGNVIHGRPAARRQVMPLFSAGQLAALALVGLQASVPATACGCAQFVPDAGNTATDHPALSDAARTLRDFVLFSHRRIGADLIGKQGPYLQSLSAFFPYCADEAVKLAWFRQMLVSTSDTSLFAERLAQQYDSGRECTVRPQ